MDKERELVPKRSVEFTEKKSRLESAEEKRTQLFFGPSTNGKEEQNIKEDILIFSHSYQRT